MATYLVAKTDVAPVSKPFDAKDTRGSKEAATEGLITWSREFQSLRFVAQFEKQSLRQQQIA